MAPRLGNIPWNKGRASKHGDWNSREYRAWIEARTRCLNPKHHAYDRYGGRGITVCERWNDYANFLADMGRRPSAIHQLDRIDNDGNYEPSNCRWVTAKEQSRNRRNNRLVTINGEVVPVAVAAERFGVSASLVRGRLKRGYSVEEALRLPSSRNRYRDRAIELSLAQTESA